MRELICINCPMGCQLKVDDTDKENIIVTGNTCNRGKVYGINEVLHPKRMVTSLVTVVGGEHAVVSCKTKEAIPKELIFDSLEVLKNTKVNAPVSIGDVLVSNILGTGVDIVATSNVKRI